MSKYKIWFQGATDRVHMAPYISKVEAHLKSILDPDFSATFHTTTPPATTTHAITRMPPKSTPLIEDPIRPSQPWLLTSRNTSAMTHSFNSFSPRRTRRTQRDLFSEMHFENISSCRLRVLRVLCGSIFIVGFDSRTSSGL